MKKKDVEDYVGGLGTVNELRDADFKLGQKYWFWNSGNGAAGSVDTNLKYKGMNTFSITVTRLKIVGGDLQVNSLSARLTKILLHQVISILMGNHLLIVVVHLLKLNGGRLTKNSC